MREVDNLIARDHASVMALEDEKLVALKDGCEPGVLVADLEQLTSEELEQLRGRYRHAGLLTLGTAEQAVWARKWGDYHLVRDQIRPDEVEVAVGVVTEFARLRHELRDSQARAQRGELLQRLAAGVVHDLKQFFQILLGYGGVLKNLHRSDAKTLEIVEEMKGAAKGATELAEQLLGLGASKALTTDLNEFLHQKSTLLRNAAWGSTLTLETGADCLPVEIDPTHLMQILLNLVSNAVEATGRGGQVTVRTEKVAQDFARLQVRDDGPGMKAETRKRLFEAYYTTKPKGHGLGLWTVKTLTEQMGGRIEVESELGRGTTFTLEFPLVRRPQLPACPDSEHGTAQA